MGDVCHSIEAVSFIKLHQVDAETVARTLNVPTENVLGLSGIESMWGANRFAKVGNNFFSLQGDASAPFAISSMKALESRKERPGKHHKKPTKATLSTFRTYLDSAKSFAAQYGTDVNGKSDPSAFAQALIVRGFNSGKAEDGGNPNFVKDTVNTIINTRTRMKC